VDAYERLRAAVLNAEPLPGTDLGTVRHRGLAAWLKGLIPPPLNKSARAKLEPVNAVANPAPNGACSLHKTGDAEASPAASELTRIIAGIVIALVTEPSHA
jgi:hypothetical protein